MLAGEEQVSIAILCGSGEDATAHPAAVDEEAEVAAAGAGQRRRADKAGSDKNLVSSIYFEHLLSCFQAVNCSDDISEVAVAGCVECQASIKREAEFHLGVSQCVLGQEVSDVAVFGGC